MDMDSSASKATADMNTTIPVNANAKLVKINVGCSSITLPTKAKEPSTIEAHDLTVTFDPAASAVTINGYAVITNGYLDEVFTITALAIPELEIVAISPLFGDTLGGSKLSSLFGLLLDDSFYGEMPQGRRRRGSTI
jgi:hypothetical protein